MRALSPSTQVDVKTPKQWRAMTAEQFMEYRALIIGDGACQSGTAAFDAAVETRAKWGAIVDGQVALSALQPVLQPHRAAGGERTQGRSRGFDPIQHRHVHRAGLRVRERAGQHGGDAVEPFGAFAVQGMPGCAATGHVFQMSPATLSDGLGDGSLEGNGCVARSVFTSYPRNTFASAAIAIGTASAPLPGQQTYIDYWYEPGRGDALPGRALRPRARRHGGERRLRW